MIQFSENRTPESSKSLHLSRTLLLMVVAFLIGNQQASAEPPILNWKLETAHAAWAPRDSQGEVVFDGKMWILGGWFDSHSAPPRDVWSSVDGKNWNLVTDDAPWQHSDLPMTVVYQDQMWFMGGWRNGRLPDRSASNQVWSSTDGRHWRQATSAAGWSPRLGAGIAVFKDRMWILGGSEAYYGGTPDDLKNDVWSTSDGTTWTQHATAPWAPRAFHQAIVLGERMYVLGGGNYDPEYLGYHDVWATTDGEHWEQCTEAAPWHPRIWFTSVNYRNRIWVLGGWSNRPSRNWGDVWHSDDGTHWTELKTPDIWKERHEQSTLVFDDKIFVLGGMIWPLTNEVWSLHIPPEFDLTIETNLPLDVKDK